MLRSKNHDVEILFDSLNACMCECIKNFMCIQYTNTIYCGEYLPPYSSFNELCYSNLISMGRSNKIYFIMVTELERRSKVGDFVQSKWILFNSTRKSHNVR